MQRRNAINGSPRGEKTIQALGLRREELRERRFDRYRMLSTLKDVAETWPDEPVGRDAQALLEEAVLDNAE